MFSPTQSIPAELIYFLPCVFIKLLKKPYQVKFAEIRGIGLNNFIGSVVKNVCSTSAWENVILVNIATGMLQAQARILSAAFSYCRRSFGTNIVQFCKMKYLNQQEAISVDEELFNDYKFSVDQLMELAGLSCAHAIADGYSSSSLKSNKVLICCGPGNNGGDGLVAARHLLLMNYEPYVYYPKRTERELFKNLQHQAESMGITVSAECPDATWVENDFGLIVDALFGFSFQPPVRESFVPIMTVLQKSTLPIVSIDIPSGWHVEQGPQSECDIKPACLISLTAPKLCAKHLANAKHYLGGRFVPKRLEDKYAMDLPTYKACDLFVRLN